jgi:hypothetical protein
MTDLLPLVCRMPRWRNAAMCERNGMKDAGLLRADSPRGTWAIAENDRAYLAEHGDPGLTRVRPRQHRPARLGQSTVRA